ncbi:hypothetical protein OSI63_14430, partial [Mycobacterium ulcerans]
IGHGGDGGNADWLGNGGGGTGGFGLPPATGGFGGRGGRLFGSPGAQGRRALMCLSAACRC